MVMGIDEKKKDKNGYTVPEHERNHVKRALPYWDAVRKEAQYLEGSYWDYNNMGILPKCKGCWSLAARVSAASTAYWKGKEFVDNHGWDVTQYGGTTEGNAKYAEWLGKKWPGIEKEYNEAWTAFKAAKCK